MKSRLLAIGDIHGCFNPLHELIERKIQLSKSDTLVLLGDYIDRGPQVKKVIDYIRALREDGYQLVTLMGNHEDMLLSAGESENNLLLWMINGGGLTLESFGIQSLDELAPDYWSFFENLPLYWSSGNYLFVHAGFDDEATDPFDNRMTLLWESSRQYVHPLLKDKIVVHGHRLVSTTECDRRIHEQQQVLDLDTGCVFSYMRECGRLTALEIGTNRIFEAWNR